MKKILFFILGIIFLVSCSGDKKENVLVVYAPTDEEAILIYKDGFEALQGGDGFFAAKKFAAAEALYPKSLWAAKSSLMRSYSLYTINFYSEAISNLNKYLVSYPKTENIVYAHYLMAICYFEQMLDEKKDQEPLYMAKKKIEFIINNFPDTDYAMDASYKLDLIIDQLAKKEMYIGRYYMQVEKWIAAINRFKKVVQKYDTTVYIEEALYRLVEIYYKIGLLEEAKKTSILLGYNYQSSEWYEKSYALFDKSYTKIKKSQKRKKDGFIKKKFKEIFK